MGSSSSIEWTDATWNPIRARNLKTGKVGWHCEHVTTGCENCYAETMNRRLGTGLPFKPGHRKDIEIFLDEKMLVAPLAWRKPRMIFCCSMTDLFAGFVKDEWIDRVVDVMAETPKHTFQVLTKRSDRMLRYGKRRIGGEPWPHIWFGVSAERQEEADARIPQLAQMPAAVRFLSAEPLLGPITLRPSWLVDLDWVIVGGESGARARPMQERWATNLRDQCKAAGVPFFFKQWGEWVGRRVSRGQVMSGIGTNQRLVTDDDGESLLLTKVGKKYAGRLLDGVEHNAMPQERK